MLTVAEIWTALAAHHRARILVSPAELFAADADRFDRFSCSLDDLLLDFSKTALDDEAIALLLQLAQAAQVERRRDAMFAGEIVNDSENRPALHTALRADGSRPITAAGGDDVMPAVLRARAEMLAFAEQCRCGEVAAADGGAYTDVVNLGIGGSDLGPAMAVAALTPYSDGLRPHFVSNLDGAHLADTLAGLDAQRTLIIISSKTFKTAETLQNAAAAHRWLATTLGEDGARRQMVAVSAAPERAAAFGVDRVFPFWEWVGGRYSVWGAVGLPLALAVGTADFEQFLAGARAMDEHFTTAPMADNLPLMLALTGVWHRNVCGYPTCAVLPYEQRLNLLPAYLQQLAMESNGKSVLQDGQAAAVATAPVVWGSAGTNAQHAYFQMLHQGTDIVPCEFIVAACGHEADVDRHRMVLANCLAQSQALFFGGPPSLPPHRRMAGGRPSVTIMYRKLTPYALGRLIALYEHRTFIEGIIWGINSFDQWGVELGKTTAEKLYAAVTDETAAAGEDSSTRGLIRHSRGS